MFHGRLKEPTSKILLEQRNLCGGEPFLRAKLYLYIGIPSQCLRKTSQNQTVSKTQKAFENKFLSNSAVRNLKQQLLTEQLTKPANCFLGNLAKGMCTQGMACILSK